MAFDERREYYEYRAQEIQRDLRERKYKERDQIVENQCSDIDKQLNDRTRRYTNPNFNYTPYGSTNRITEKDIGSPTAMEKVEAELDKQDYRRPLNNDIQYDQSKITLEEKERERDGLQDQTEKEAFSDAVNIQGDRDFISSYEEQQERNKQREEKVQEHLEREAQAPTTQNDTRFSDKVGKAEKDFNERFKQAEIYHQGATWEYQKEGQSELFLTKDAKGDLVATIEKVDSSKSFEEGKNARIEMRNRPDLQKQPRNLEEIMKTESPEIEKAKKEIAQEKTKEDFNRERWRGKPTVDFNNPAPSTPPSPPDNLAHDEPPNNGGGGGDNPNNPNNRSLDDPRSDLRAKLAKAKKQKEITQNARPISEDSKVVQLDKIRKAKEQQKSMSKTSKSTADKSIDKSEISPANDNVAPPSKSKNKNIEVDI